MKPTSDVLESLRPDPLPLDPAWSQRTLTAITQSHDPAPEPVHGKRRRLAVVALAATFISVTGAGAAAAGGLMPQPFVDAFSFWKTIPVDAHPVDPATAERVATAKGPHGTVFSVLSTGHGQRFACRTGLIETAKSAAGPGPSSFTDVTSNFCSDAPSSATFGSVDINYQQIAAGFIVSAGTAVRAEVHTKDGRELPALLVEGDFWGWFPASEHPTLVGYAADGSVIGRLRL